MSPTEPRLALQSVWKASLGAFGSSVAVGIDLVEVAALGDLLDAGGQAFVDSAWTPSEQRDAENSSERLAARWAAKEAVMKALQAGIGELDPCEVEVITRADGAPVVVLHGGASAVAEQRGISGWQISLTHEGGWAAAIAVAIQDPLEPSMGTGAQSERRKK